METDVNKILQRRTSDLSPPPTDSGGGGVVIQAGGGGVSAGSEGLVETAPSVETGCALIGMFYVRNDGAECVNVESIIRYVQAFCPHYNEPECLGPRLNTLIA